MTDLARVLEALSPGLLMRQDASAHDLLEGVERVLRSHGVEGRRSRVADVQVGAVGLFIHVMYTTAELSRCLSVAASSPRLEHLVVVTLSPRIGRLLDGARFPARSRDGEDLGDKRVRVVVWRHT